VLAVAGQGKKSRFESGTHNFEITQLGPVLEEGGQERLWLFRIDLKFLIQQLYRGKVPPRL
jgi:hypothetical protein